jgi:multiple sugar transport system substrate-binding protein
VKRRYLGVLAMGLTTTIAFTLTSCGDESSLASDKVTLKLVTAEYGDRSGNSSKRYWDQLVGEFEFKNPDINVDVDVYPSGQIDQKVAALVKEGKAPDIAQLGAYANYAAKGKLYRADQLLSIPTQASFVSGIANAGKMRHVQYGIPFVASTRVFFYNKELFAKAGITKPPATWDELEADAILLKQAGVKWPYGLPLGPEESQAETLNWMLSGGGGYTDAIGNYTFGSKENTRAFEWLRDELVGQGLTNPDPASSNRREIFNAFTHGDVAMLNGTPTLMELAQENGVQFGTAPLPGRTGPSKTTTGVAEWMMAFKQNGHDKEIGKFLDFVYKKENVLRFADQYDLLPVTTAASDAMRADPAKKDVREFLDQLQTAHFYPFGKSSWAPLMSTLKQKIGSTVEKQGDPGSVLEELQREAESLENTHSK